MISLQPSSFQFAQFVIELLSYYKKCSSSREVNIKLDSGTLKNNKKAFWQSYHTHTCAVSPKTVKELRKNSTQLKTDKMLNLCLFVCHCAFVHKQKKSTYEFLQNAKLQLIKSKP